MTQLVQQVQMRAPQSPQSIRSRRSELVRMSRVFNTGIKRTMSTGRKAIVWSYVPVQE